MNTSIDKMANATEKNKIVLIHRDEIKPDPNNDRDDWNSEETQEHLSNLSKSISTILEDGRPYGIRTPLIVTVSDSDGKHMIIDGECRWRATENLSKELQILPCIIRNGSEKEKRLDHVSSNAVRKNLTLVQVANSVAKDKELGFSTDEISKNHALGNKTNVSKFLALSKLKPETQAIFIDFDIKDVNAIYALKKLEAESNSDNDLVQVFRKHLEKGATFTQASKSLDKEIAKLKDNDITTEEEQEVVNKPKSKKNAVSISLNNDEAVSLANLLNIKEAELMPLNVLQENIINSIKQITE